MRTVGVEEEFLVMDAHLDDRRATAAEVLLLATPYAGGVRPGSGPAGVGPYGSLVAEFMQQQLEANTSPHVRMDLLRAELVAWRLRAASATRHAGARLIASGTAPVPVVPLPVHTERYDRMMGDFGIIAREHLTCGCHVHVSVGSQEEAVGVLDRIRVWLPLLRALSANSPFWQGQDTDFATFRSHVMGRWPATGPMDVLGSADAYRALVAAMISTGVVIDEGMVYFDARCSARHPTIEIRVADVCLDVSDTVVLAALCRALVETAAQEWAEGVPAPAVPTELVRLASWRATRWGTDGDLLDPLTARPAPAADVLAALVAHVASALRATGDEELVTQGVARILVRGNGAARQREAFAVAGRLEDVLTMVERETVIAG